MAGMLGSGGGYRRAVLAVAVTGTVCAGVGLAWYFGMKKLRDRESLSPADSEAEKVGMSAIWVRQVVSLCFW